MDESNQSIRDGVVNLVPINLVQVLKYYSPDVFIAMWSLTEADRETQIKIESLDFFGAKAIVVFRHRRTNADIPNTNDVRFDGYDLRVEESLGEIAAGYSAMEIYVNG